MSTSQGTFTIVNEKGLHARASAKFVDMVEQFDANATIEKDGIDASGDSIMGHTGRYHDRRCASARAFDRPWRTH